MQSSQLILCRPLFLLLPIPPSIRVFSNESTLRLRWPKYWSFSFSIIPSKEIPGLISFKMAWLDLLAVQGTLRSLLQHHSSKASILRCSAFFTVQLSLSSREGNKCNSPQSERRGIILWRVFKYLKEVVQIAEILYLYFVSSFIADSANYHLGLG